MSTVFDQVEVSSKYSKIPDNARAEIIETIYGKTDSGLIRKFSAETLRIVRDNNKLSRDVWNIVVAKNANPTKEDKKEEHNTPLSTSRAEY